MPSHKRDHENALKVSGNNIPRQTMWDLRRTWKDIPNQLPAGMRPAQAEWDSQLDSCLQSTRYNPSNFPTTRDVYKLRKELSGLVCGPIDKNPHELWFCCPTLYEKAWKKLYCENTGYKPIFPKVYSTKTRQSKRDVIRTTRPLRGKIGTPTDVLKAWERIYKENQWNHLASFQKAKAGFNLPYLLFKAKNITDPDKRQTAWMKARPIAPQTKHPMRQLFHKAGRAWYFLMNNLPENRDNFIIRSSGDVPAFLAEAEEQLRPLGKLSCTVEDIEGCFPNMPKSAIETGLRHHLRRITERYKYDQVCVPNKQAKSCTFRSIKRRGWTTIPFEDLLDIMTFALRNTVIRDFDGNLWKQDMGIPMGDPHSPGLTIGACAWMEETWRNQTEYSPSTVPLRVRRYMDDVIMVRANNSEAHAEKWVDNLREN